MPPTFPPFAPDPDINRLLAVLHRSGLPDRVPFFELLADAVLIEAVLGEPLTPAGLEGEDAFRATAKNEIRFWHGMGYDYYCVRGDFGWPRRITAEADDTAAISKGHRTWVQQEGGVITNREQFEKYPWPPPVPANRFAHVPWLASQLPDGMGLTFRISGVLENVMWLMGYEGVSFALADDPELVRAVADKVGRRAAELFAAVLSHKEIRATLLGDDMGFKTQTMLPPDLLREFIFPRQKKLADMSHAHGAPFILHSCGKLDAVMDDLIDYVGIDAKHSFEDAIQPIEEAYAKWGERVALLGGVDVDLLARGEGGAVRSRVREILAKVAPGGGFALGSGNSLANYVRIGNVLAMLDEGRKRG